MGDKKEQSEGNYSGECTYVCVGVLKSSLQFLNRLVRVILIEAVICEQSLEVELGHAWYVPGISTNQYDIRERERGDELSFILNEMWNHCIA